jgi:hypothetical protein
MFQLDGLPIRVAQLGKALDYSSIVRLLFFCAARVPQITHDGSGTAKPPKIEMKSRRLTALLRTKSSL